jgi:C1A family cysteine protease
MPVRKYLLKRSLPDHRDFLMAHPTASAVEALPPVFDLRNPPPPIPQMPPVLDQKSLGSCALNATSNTLRHLLEKEKLPVWQPSRLYMYYNTRVNIENSPAGEDTGVCIRDVCKALSKYHACSEDTWPYDIEKFSEEPPKSAYNEANLHKKIQYRAVPLNVDAIKHAVFQGTTVIIGIQLYESFESEEVAKTGIVPMPKTETETLLGGHAMTLCGWNDETKMFIIQNSWGPDKWGEKGYCYIPYDYIVDPKLGGDYWTLTFFS